MARSKTKTQKLSSIGVSPPDVLIYDHRISLPPTVLSKQFYLYLAIAMKIVFLLSDLFKRMRFTSVQRTTATLAVKKIETEELPSLYTTDVTRYNHIYVIPKNNLNLLGRNITKQWRLQSTAFGEFGLLVRRPAIDIMTYLKNANYDKCMNKYVLYGKVGTGKTTTILHVIQYALQNDFLLLHLPWVNDWFILISEITPSAYEPDKLDLPQQAAKWLLYFVSLNKKRLEELDLTLTKEYVWNSRETTPAGAKIFDLITFGVQRIKYASGVIAALIDELKVASNARKCKTLIVIDGFNAFMSNKTYVSFRERRHVPASEISITKIFYDSVNYNWCNGAAILSVDIHANRKGSQEHDTPKHLLGDAGFEHLDPFVPILMENYSIDEFEVILDYYKQRKWILNITPDGEKELELLSGKHPLTFWQLSKSLN